MNIREYQERMNDALGEVKRLLVQSEYTLLGTFPY